MRTIQKTTIFAALAICLISTAHAAKRFDASRPLPAPPGGLRVLAMTPAGGSVAPLGVGGSTSLRMCAAWASSDYEADTFSTNYLWCDFESLQVIAGFSTPVSRDVHALVVIKDSSGVVVYQAVGDLSIVPSVINYILADVGPLPAGFYKVISKIKQGDRVVGQSFWFQVTAQSDPQCSPAAAQ